MTRCEIPAVLKCWRYERVFDSVVTLDYENLAWMNYRNLGVFLKVIW